MLKYKISLDPLQFDTDEERALAYERIARCGCFVEGPGSSDFPDQKIPASAKRWWSPLPFIQTHHDPTAKLEREGFIIEAVEEN